MGRPETDFSLQQALFALGNGLYQARRLQESLDIYKSCLAILGREGHAENSLMCNSIRVNIANCYGELGKHLEALPVYRDVYTLNRRAYGEEDSLDSALALSIALVNAENFREAKKFISAQLHICQRLHGADDLLTLRLRQTYAIALSADSNALEDLIEAEATLADVYRVMRRVLGDTHYDTQHVQNVALPGIRKILASARAAQL